MTNKFIDLPPLEINILIKRSGSSQQQIADDIGVTLQAVNRVVNGKLKSDRIQQYIAKKTGVDVKHIWPSIYLYGDGAKGPGRPPLQNNEKQAA